MLVRHFFDKIRTKQIELIKLSLVTAIRTDLLLYFISKLAVAQSWLIFIFIIRFRLNHNEIHVRVLPGFSVFYFETVQFTPSVCAHACVFIFRTNTDIFNPFHKFSCIKCKKSFHFKPFPLWSLCKLSWMKGSAPQNWIRVRLQPKFLDSNSNPNFIIAQGKLFLCGRSLLKIRKKVVHFIFMSSFELCSKRESLAGRHSPQKKNKFSHLTFNNNNKSNNNDYSDGREWDEIGKREERLSWLSLKLEFGAGLSNKKHFQYINSNKTQRNGSTHFKEKFNSSKSEMEKERTSHLPPHIQSERNHFRHLIRTKGATFNVSSSAILECFEKVWLELGNQLRLPLPMPNFYFSSYSKLFKSFPLLMGRLTQERTISLIPTAILLNYTLLRLT